jgi:hypothetical protein
MEGSKATLERMLESKVPSVFTACFVPRCGVSTPRNDSDFYSGDSFEFNDEAFMQMEINVKKHVSNVIQENVSIMTEGDEALLAELHDIGFDDDSISDFSQLNTIGEETMGDIENRRVEKQSDASKSRLPKLPGAYKQSVKSKFELYRAHQRFNVGALRPIDENCEIEVEFSRIQKTFSEQPSIDMAELAVDPQELKLVTPSSRRNELAKQILQRRQHQPMMQTCA